MLRVLFLVITVSLAGCAGTTSTEATDPLDDQVILQGIVVTEAIVPIAGASVSGGDGLQNVTDAKGAFRIGPVDPGTYKLRIEAVGYATQTIDVVAREGAEVVKVVLAAISTEVPYHQVEQFQGYLECTFDTWVAPYQILGAPCLGLIDLVADVTVSWDEWQFVWTVDAPGLAGVLIEMVWEEQATGSQMGMLLRNVAGAGSGVDAGGTNIDTQYYSTRGASPIKAWVYQGIENPGADAGAVFQEEQNETMDYKILILGRADYDQAADVHLMFQNTPEVFLTKFYNALGDESYTIVG